LGAPGTAVRVLLSNELSVREVHVADIHFEGAGYFDAEGESTRVAVNGFIRGGAFDRVIDFESALKDPGHPTRLLPAYDRGDHLHPNDAGFTRMAQAVAAGSVTDP
jgi:lysophospholipase L1-like esterase